jgi:RNA polymerase sigma-70 factor (ECF subfamily)
LRPQEIVEQFDEPIRRWFARRVTQPADAEDLAQETIIAAIESLPRFRGDSSPRTWVYAIARNQLLKYIRGARRRPLSLPADQDTRTGVLQTGCPGPPDHTAEDATNRITVQVIVSHLPVALREVYNLFYCDGRATREIARQLHRSQGTVKYQLYEIRRRVRRALE